MDDVFYLSPESIREKFNQSQYPDMIQGGILQAQFLRNNHLEEPEKVGEPFCTHGQMIRYLDSKGQWVVEVFQYLRSDNTLGASGKPDPKRLRIGDIIFAIDTSKKK